MRLYPFTEIVSDVTSKFSKVKASEYNPEGPYKIIDQGKEPVAGYTDRADLVNFELRPIIVFGDHTRIFKYVESPIALGADGAKALIVNPRMANSLYVYFYFRSINIKAAGYSRHFKFLKETKIPIPFKDGQPNLDDQIRIAHLLGKVEGLIAQRKENLQQLDELLKSVFLEMFGDIKAKKSVHEWEKPRPYLTANSGKSSNGVKSNKETEFPIYGGNGVNGWASKPLYIEPVVIAGRVGQQCGIIHVSRGPCWVTDNAIALSITDHNKLNTTYLATAFQNAPIREKVKQLDLPFINQSMLLDFPIPMPLIDLQNQFAAIVEKVESLKLRYQQCLTELENLYGALSQKAFKGELDLARVPLPQRTAQSLHEETNPPEQNQESRTHSAEQAGTINADPSQIEQLDIPAMSTAQGRAKILGRLFKTYIKEPHSGAPLSLDDFWQNVQLKTLDYLDEDSDPLGLADYDLVKKCLFRFLETGEVVQTFNEDKNRLELQARG